MFSDELKQLLLNNFPEAAPASGGNFVVMRCKYCGDSDNLNSKHMYIGLGYDNNIPFFYCHLCHSTGHITPEVLSYWDVYDIDFSVKLSKRNKYLKSTNKNYIDDKEFYNIKNNFISDNKLSEVKLKYINKRLNSNLTYNDLINMKIVLNLYDLLQYNNIVNLTRDKRIVDELDKSFLGFISVDNAFLNLRNLRRGKVSVKSIDKKYINYNLFNKSDNTQRFYIIPTQINLNNPDPIKIHIAEGCFDILSIYLNLRKNSKHNIYSAILGSGYINIIKHFINRLKLINIEIHIYKDNDINNYVINNIQYLLKPFFIPLYIHTNVFPGEKDFGVPIEKINEQVERIL